MRSSSSSGAVAFAVLGVAVGVVALAAACSSSSGGGQSGASVPDDASIITPGCIGTPHASCAPYSDGTQCVGSTSVCLQCAPGSYTFAPSDCTCASGSWSCAAPAAGSVMCASPVGQYDDPSCTILYPGDAAIDVPQYDGGADGGIDGGATVDAGTDAGTDGGVDAGSNDAGDDLDGGDDASG